MNTLHSVYALSYASFTTLSFYLSHKIKLYWVTMIPNPWLCHCTDNCVVRFYVTWTQPIMIKVNCEDGSASEPVWMFCRSEIWQARATRKSQSTGVQHLTLGPRLCPRLHQSRANKLLSAAGKSGHPRGGWRTRLYWLGLSPRFSQLGRWSLESWIWTVRIRCLIRDNQ